MYFLKKEVKKKITEEARMQEELEAKCEKVMLPQGKQKMEPAWKESKSNPREVSRFVWTDTINTTKG